MVLVLGCFTERKCQPAQKLWNKMSQSGFWQNMAFNKLFRFCSPSYIKSQLVTVWPSPPESPPNSLKTDFMKVAIFSPVSIRPLMLAFCWSYAQWLLLPSSNELPVTCVDPAGGSDNQWPCWVNTHDMYRSCDHFLWISFAHSSSAVSATQRRSLALHMRRWLFGEYLDTLAYCTFLLLLCF